MRSSDALDPTTPHFRASARTVTAIIPYYGYSRQDEKRRPRVPIASSDIAMLMEAAGVDRVLSVDLHSGQIQGQFQHCPVDNLSMFEDFAAFFVKHLLPTFPEGSEVAVVSPDADGTARAKFFLGLLIERGATPALIYVLLGGVRSLDIAQIQARIPDTDMSVFESCRCGKCVACHYDPADNSDEHSPQSRRRGGQQGVHHHRRHYRHW